MNQCLLYEELMKVVAISLNRRDLLGRFINGSEEDKTEN